MPKQTRFLPPDDWGVDDGAASKRNVHLREMLLQVFTDCLQISHDIGVK